MEDLEHGQVNENETDCDPVNEGLSNGSAVNSPVQGDTEHGCSRRVVEYRPEHVEVFAERQMAECRHDHERQNHASEDRNTPAHADCPRHEHDAASQQEGAYD